MENTLKSSVGYIRSIQASIGAIAVSCAFVLSPLASEISTSRLSPASSVAHANSVIVARKRDDSSEMDQLVRILGDLHEGLDSDYMTVQNNTGEIDSSAILVFQQLADALTSFIDDVKPAAKKGSLDAEGLNVFDGLVDARMKSLRIVSALRQQANNSVVFESSIDTAGLIALSQQARKVEMRSV